MTLADPTGKADAFTRGAKIGVDVTGIERELASLWRQASSNKERAVTRACSWNLLVHVAREEDVEGARALVDKIVFPVPSRAVLIVPQSKDSEKEIEAYVSANCQVAPGGGKLLCSEEITICSRDQGQRHVPSLIRALLVPDVPAALYWVGSPPTDPRSIPFFPSVDRLIFDSSGWDTKTALECAARYAGLPRTTVLVDLAWLRTGFLRSMLASIFDPPIGTDPLDRATDIEIRSSKNGFSSAMLFAAWMASRLGWTLPRMGTEGASGKRKDGTAVTVRLRVSESDRGSANGSSVSGLEEVILRSTDPSGSPLVFSVTDSGDGSLRVNAPGKPDHSKIAADLAVEKLAIAALGARGRDRLYRAALEFSTAIGSSTRPREGSGR